MPELSISRINAKLSYFLLNHVTDTPTVTSILCDGCSFNLLT
jgi:hypothetical protein